MDKLLSETLAGKHFGSFVMVDSLEISLTMQTTSENEGNRFSCAKDLSAEV